MKKNYLLFIICTLTALLLAGCTANKKEEVDEVDQVDNMVTTENGKETVEATESGDAQMDVASTESNWKVIMESQMFQDSNFEGFLNENFGISVGYAGAVSYTEDGAKTWTKGENSSMCRFCLDIVDENLAWCGGNGNNVRVTKDGGKTWNVVSDAVLSSTHSNIDFLDDTTGWISSGKVCMTTCDGGTTWTELDLPKEIGNIGALAIRTDSNGYILSNSGLLFVTSDGGATWTQKDTGMTDLGIKNEKGEPGLYKYKTTTADMNFYDEKNGTIVFSGLVPGEGTKLWSMVTQDGGDSWTTEEIPVKEGFNINKVYLSGDGKYLTIGSITKEVMLLTQK